MSHPKRTLLAAALVGMTTLTMTTAPAAIAAETGKPNAGKPAAAPAAKWETARGKHTGSGVVVRYSVPDKIAVGETVTVRLMIAGVSAAEGASVEVRDPATQAVLLSTRAERGEEKAAELRITARNDGTQYLDVQTTQAGRLTVQSIALRVGSGKTALKAEGQKQTTATGETVISMPATEPGKK
jgi:hypothetical protein